jgi:hypothetical protein
MGKKAIEVGLKRSKESASAKDCRGDQSSRARCTALLGYLASLLTFDTMSMDPVALPLSEMKFSWREYLVSDNEPAIIAYVRW